MTTFEFNGKSFYIDNELANQLDTKIVPDLKKKDMDAVYLIDGGERMGKSRWGQILAAYMAMRLNSKFDISNICMTPAEFRHKILTAEKNECVIYDEAHRGMASARSLSEVNTILKDLMMEMGQRNLFILIVLPSFFLLDKYVALFRSRGMFHIYMNKGSRGFWVYYNQKQKLKLYLKGKKEFNYNATRFPKFRGRFLDQFPVPEVEYNAKKSASFGTIEESNKSKQLSNTEERYMLQRDISFKELWLLKGKPPVREFRDWLVTKGVDISDRRLRDIIRPSEESTNSRLAVAI